MDAKYCGLVGAINKSAGSESGILFLSSCKSHTTQRQKR
jgi:hypothetical protein